MWIVAAAGVVLGAGGVRVGSVLACLCGAGAAVLAVVGGQVVASALLVLIGVGLLAIGALFNRVLRDEPDDRIA
ncbi:MAG: hypothetical protein ACR2NB_12320 [Solirubrobacteraceae bacterium]